MTKMSTYQQGLLKRSDKNQKKLDKYIKDIDFALNKPGEIFYLDSVKYNRYKFTVPSYDCEIIDDLLEHYKYLKTDFIRNYEHYDYDCLFIYS